MCVVAEKEACGEEIVKYTSSTELNIFWISSKILELVTYVLIQPAVLSSASCKYTFFLGSSLARGEEESEFEITSIGGLCLLPLTLSSFSPLTLQRAANDLDRYAS